MPSSHQSPEPRPSAVVPVGPWVLAVWLALTVFAVGITLSPARKGFADGPSRGGGDVALYRAEVERMQAGSDYYAAIAAELRARGYPTRSLFNWRTPLPVAALGHLPDPRWGQALLAALALWALVWAFDSLASEGPSAPGEPADRPALAAALLVGLLLPGALLPTILGDLYVMPELWSGVLVLLAVLAAGRGAERISLACGLAALFVRELAAPAVLVLVGRSVWLGRWRQLAAWLGGLALYALYYTAHARQVFALIEPGDVAHPGSWWQVGGLPFVLATCQMNAYLLVLPQAVTAVALTLALVGLWNWRTPLGRTTALALGGYLAAFSLVGYDFNQYWGSMFAPLLAVATGRGAVVLGVSCPGIQTLRRGRPSQPAVDQSFVRGMG